MSESTTNGQEPATAPIPSEMLEELKPEERLQALLMWMKLQGYEVSQQSEKLDTLLKEADGMDSNEISAVLNKLNSDDMAMVAILNEFGSTFKHRKAYNTLKNLVSQRLESHI